MRTMKLLSVFLSALLLPSLPGMQETLTAQAVCGQATPHELKIALTFDDGPVSTTVRLSTRRQNQLIFETIETLDRFAVQAVFFLNGARVRPYHREALRRAKAQGHRIGNHTLSHIDLHATSSGKFVRNIVKGEWRIRKWQTVPKYFRFPSLREGRPGPQRDQVFAYLASSEYTVVPGSILMHDHRHIREFESPGAPNRLLRMKKRQAIGRAYLKEALQAVETHERWALRKFGRPITQIIVMHFNRLTAAMLPHFIQSLILSRHSFVPIEEALLDPAYRCLTLSSTAKTTSWLGRDLYCSEPGIFPPNRY